jgi:hypothetical protein
LNVSHEGGLQVVSKMFVVNRDPVDFPSFLSAVLLISIETPILLKD